MTGFLSSIQGYFTSRFSGRYFAFILRELARHEPSSFLRIVELAGKRSRSDKILSVYQSIRPGQFDAECELTFVGDEGQRRADLAITRD
jgi:hypothetical protein